MHDPKACRKVLCVRTSGLRRKLANQSDGLLAAQPGVLRTKFDFCMLGMESHGPEGTELARKTTGIMTNSPIIAEILSGYRCDGSHAHTRLVNGRAKACEVYPEPFCRAICRGYALQIEEDEKMKRNGNGLHVGAVAGDVMVTDVSEVMDPLVAREAGGDRSPITPGTKERRKEGSMEEYEP